MAQFRVGFDCDNAVFEPPYTADAIADALLDVSKRIRRSHELSGSVRDNNGNTVGRFEFSFRNDLNT